MNTKYTAAVITVSDKGSRGERIDTSGPAVKEMLEAEGWEVIRTAIVSDDKDAVKQELKYCADELRAALILTTGGTGFSPRDNTPEVTKKVVDREVPGIPEAMRAKSMQITDRACLSRAACGIRKQSLIVNLPGSEKAARENLSAVLSPLRHGVDMLASAGSADCAGSENAASSEPPALSGTILAVCISEKKGVQKHPVDEIELLPDHGIVGDAHAGNWHRQVSLLGKESVDKVQPHISFTLLPGVFAENILTEGLLVYQLPVGTKVAVGTATGEVTQIGKECHSDCDIRKAAGDCVMPREGIFIKILTPGRAKAGDTVRVID